MLQLPTDTIALFREKHYQKNPARINSNVNSGMTYRKSENNVKRNCDRLW